MLTPLTTQRLTFPCEIDAQGGNIPDNPNQERLRVILIGTSEGVTEAIHSLHRRGFAEAGSWSGLLPTANPNEVMSIHTRYRRRR